MKLKPIDQQVVAVVGASSGIGRQTAIEFARRGAKVVVAARSQSGLDSLVQEIRDRNGEAIAIAADVTDFDQMQAIAAQAVTQYGRLDTWVHLAAIELYASFEQTTPEEFRRVIEVNLMGQVHGAKAALPHLRQAGGGALIHVSSVEAKRSLPLQSAYAASKHGIDGFVEALRVELMHEKAPISVTEIMPASINTPFFDQARTKLGVKPMGVPPLYQPQLVAEAILHAAVHPSRDIVVGDAGKMILLGQRLSPGLVDAYMVRTCFDQQRTDQPKSADAPDNFYEPLPGFDTAEGTFYDQTQPSPLSWLETHPVAQWGAIALATLGGAAALGFWRVVKQF